MIAAISDALAERAQSGAAVPPRLEALVESLTDKIEQIQSSRGNGDAFGHLEDRLLVVHDEHAFSRGAPGRSRWGEPGCFSEAGGRFAAGGDGSADGWFCADGL